MFSQLDPVYQLFTTSAQVSQQYQSLALSSLQRGAQQLANGNTQAAVTEFKRAMGYDPSNTDVYLDLGQTYEQMGNMSDAITTYKKGLQVDGTNSDLQSALAYAYMNNKQYPEAEKAFKQIVLNNNSDAGSVASLGYFYMTTQDYSQAETQFLKAVQISPSDPAAHYSLGLVYNKEGRYTDAVAQLQTALSLRPTYPLATAELARSYIGLGQTDKANDLVTQLQGMNTTDASTYASELQQQMYTPKIVYADLVHSTLDTTQGANTAVSSLSSNLATPGAMNTFKMVFQFNQAMDLNSVQNVFNWNISRASGGQAGTYNNGTGLNGANQISVMPIPITVSYDPSTMQATVYFRMSQNQAGTGVTDPAHWVFQFNGVASDGSKMDPGADQWDGFHGSPF